MFKLGYKMSTLGILVAIVVAAIVLASPHDTNNYLAAARDKHRLLYSVASPRIILAGGSNVAFSIDSAKILERFHVPVVNMGLHVDMGLRYMLNEIAPALRDGDVVLIFPEYEHFSGLPLDGRPLELGSAIKFCPECISGITTPTQLFNVAVGMVQTAEGDILRGIKNSKSHEKIYLRQGFDQNGDMVAHLRQSDKLKPNNHVSVITALSPNSAINLLNLFYQTHRADNVQIFVIFPAIPVTEYENQEKDFVALYNLLSAEIEIPILGVPQDFLYPEDFFYDTVYHMNRVGREAHTKDIIDMLVSEFEK
ncbi:MAG: hypothetical protein PHQ36_12710 [Anaerolineales bacterium]|nr:hypothetical protein [Anaerolineales bacterium]